MSFISVVSPLFPKTRKIYNALDIPFACIVCPELSKPLPRVQFPRKSVPRCLYCKAHVSPYCQLNENSWTCGLCTCENKLDSDYSQVVSPLRIEFTELNYEIFAEEYHMERAPMCPCYLFLLDISESSVESGFVAVILSSISEIFKRKREDPEERALIGFVLFDTQVHYVSVFPSVKVHTEVSELNEHWLPVPSDYLLVSLFDHYEALQTVISKLKTIKDSGYTNSAYQKALLSSQLLLENNGGKIISFLYCPKMDSLHPKKLALIASTGFYHELSEQLVLDHISCDIFIVSYDYCGLFTYGDICKQTGGDIYFYDDFSAKTGYEALHSDLCRVLLGMKGWESSLRLRTSPECKILTRHGHFFLQKDLLQIPCYSSGSYTFDLYLKFLEIDSNYLTLQASFLYTSSDSIRLIRVMNYQLSVNDGIEDLLSSINCNVLISVLTKHAVTLMFKRSMLLAGQKFLEAKAIDVMKSCLVVFNGLPANLKNFLVRILGLMKHFVFVNSFLPYNSHLERLVCLMYKVQTLKAEESEVWSYPVLQDLKGNIVNLASRFIVKNSYLVNDGVEIVVWKGNDYVWAWIQWRREGIRESYQPAAI